MLLTRRPRREPQTELREPGMGPNHITRSEALDRRGEAGAFGSLAAAEARTPGWYWISSFGERVPESGTVPPDTWRGVPKVAGYYRINKGGSLEGTYTRLGDKAGAKWQDLLSVSEDAAAMASKGEEPLIVSVGHMGYGAQLSVYTRESPKYTAQVILVPLAQGALRK